MTKQAPLTISIALALGLPTVGFALTPAEMDVNGDGVLTIDEVQAAYPDVDTDAFTAMDLNADGALDSEEVAAAQEAGIMPTSDG